jgi:hypothetical protein
MEPSNRALATKIGATDVEMPAIPHVELQVGLIETRDRLGIPDPDAAPKSSPGVAEPEYLKQKLLEQEQARLEALETAAELQMQLAAAQAEVARSKSQYFGVPKSRGALTRAESELSETNTKLHEAKKALDFEKRARRAESIQAAARIKSLESQLSEALGANGDSASKVHPKLFRIVLGAVAALALAAGIAALAMHRPVPASASDAVSANTAPEAGDQALAAWQSKSALVKRHSAPAQNFTESYDRLSQALAALPGRDPEDVLHQLQKAGKGCQLRWNDGEPSLIFGRQGGGATSKPNTLEAELTQCAEAVEKLR